jgi:hypothetical protein
MLPCQLASWSVHQSVYHFISPLAYARSTQNSGGWQQHDWVALVIADSERDMQGMEHGPQGWQTSALITHLQEVSPLSLSNNKKYI